jgi:hypothetical protein
VIEMRRHSFDPSAKKRTLTSRLPAKLRAEIEQDLAAYDAYVEKHGSPAEMLRDHLAKRDDKA